MGDEALATEVSVRDCLGQRLLLATEVSAGDYLGQRLLLAIEVRRAQEIASVKVAAYQAPLSACAAAPAVAMIRVQVERCEAEGVEILCCPEGALGGLADHVRPPARIAIDAEGGQLAEMLAPLASATVATIVGFTEIDRLGRLYNAAAVFHRGQVIGVYRKLFPAINHSVYQPGHEMPVFTVGDLTFGILICLDSNYFEPAMILAARGAAALFVPTNNGLPANKAGAELVAHVRNADIARAIENGVSVVRADVAGRTLDLVSHGSSEIVDRDGMVLAAAARLTTDLIIADIKTAADDRRRRWNAGRNPAVAAEYVHLVTAGRADGAT